MKLNETADDACKFYFLCKRLLLTITAPSKVKVNPKVNYMKFVSRCLEEPDMDIFFLKAKLGGTMDFLKVATEVDSGQ